MESYGGDVISKISGSRRFLKGVRHFERQFYVEGDVAPQPLLVLVIQSVFCYLTVKTV